MALPIDHSVAPRRPVAPRLRHRPAQVPLQRQRPDALAVAILVAVGIVAVLMSLAVLAAVVSLLQALIGAHALFASGVLYGAAPVGALALIIVSVRRGWL